MKLCIITGEASGDMHAAAVVAELNRLDAAFSAFGIGGEHLAREGVRLIAHVRDVALVGFSNVVRRLPMYLRLFRRTFEEIQAQKPDAVLLVDFPGFNLRMARRCKEAGLKVIFYISPQVWAWRQSRLRHIARYVDHTIVIFPFEKDFYEKHGVAVTYTGNPLVEQLEQYIRPRPELPSDPIRLALLPGSRDHEIELLFPAMLDGIRLLRTERRISAFVIKAPTIERAHLQRIVRERGIEVEIIDSDDTKSSLAAADIAVVSSGTATLEAAVLGVPLIMVYRLSRASHFLARRLVTLQWFSLVNIVAGKAVIPEVLQEEVNGPAIAEAVRTMLLPENYRRVTEELAAVREKLGQRGASRRAAEKILTLVSSQ